MKFYDAKMQVVETAKKEKPFLDRLTKFVQTSNPTLLVVHAGPTSGKTYLFEGLSKISGLKVIDTDNIIKEFVPAWFDNHKKGVARTDIENALIEVVSYLLASRSAESNVTFLLTNLYGRQIVQKLNGRRLPLSVYRSAEDLQRVWDLRGSQGSPDFKGWIDGWSKTPFAEEKVILEKDEYLSDALDYVSVQSLVVHPTSVNKLITKL
jgi:hypothetical protein